LVNNWAKFYQKILKTNRVINGRIFGTKKITISNAVSEKWKLDDYDYLGPFLL